MHAAAPPMRKLSAVETMAALRNWVVDWEVFLRSKGCEAVGIGGGSACGGGGDGERVGR